MIAGKGGRGPNPDDKAVNTFGAQFAEVEVNVETGQVRVLKVVAVHDIGRVVNPLTATSQVYGGVAMGLGFGIMEKRMIDVALRYGTNHLTVEKWKATFAIKAELEGQMGRSIYDVLPGVVENTFRS